MEKILILGGAQSQIPIIKYAKNCGYYVITVDYLPENPGHAFADEYFNISTIDKHLILRLAKRLEINAVSSYASDPSALTAAFISEDLNLIGGSYKAVEILSKKNLFRQFLLNNGFNAPWYISGRKLLDFLEKYNGEKAILKPIDSSGSKGVFVIKNKNDIIKHFNESKQFSQSGILILEQYIERIGPQIHGEGFVVDGKIKFILLGDQYFSEVRNVIPFSTIMPSIAHKTKIDDIKDIVALLLQKVQFGTGGINIEAIIGKDHKVYILEVGPRNGGNYMPQMAKYCSGIDLIKANIDALFHKKLAFNLSKIENHFFQIILHSVKNGIFNKIKIPDIFIKNLIEENVYYKSGDVVQKYKNSSDVIGVLIFRLNRNHYDKYLTSLKSHNWVDVSDFKFKILQKRRTLLQIHNYLIQNQELFFPPLEERVNRFEYAKKLFENSIQFWLFSGEEIVGFMSCYFNDSSRNIGFITTISVCKKYQKHGLGEELLNVAFNYGVKNNFKKLQLKVNLKNNVQEFYKKYNFFEIDRFNDTILYEKKLID